MLVCIKSHHVDDDDAGSPRWIQEGEYAEVIGRSDRSGYHVGVPHNYANGFYSQDEFEACYREIGPTTGPWTVSKDRVHEYKDGECWNVPVWANCAESGNKIAAYAFAKDREQARANAILIASAPSLVIAAKQVLDLVEAEGRDTGLGDAFSRLRDAIEASGL